MEEDTSFNKQDRERVSILEREVSKLGADVHYIKEAVDRLVNTTNQPTNWGWIVSALLAGSVIFGGYTTLITEPIRGSANKNESTISMIRDRQYSNTKDLGAALEQLKQSSTDRQTIIDAIVSQQKEISAASTTAAEIRGQLLQLEKRIEGLDRYANLRQEQSAP